MRILLLLVLCLAPLTHAEGLLDRLPGLGGSSQAAFLPPDEAFGLETSVKDAQTLTAKFRVAPDYYLYRDKVSFTIKSGAAKIRKISMPRGDVKQDPNFGEMMVFHKSFQAEVALVNTSTTAQNIVIEAIYQGCSEQGLCYPPINKEFKLKLPAAAIAAAPPVPANTSAQTDSIAAPTSAAADTGNATPSASAATAAADEPATENSRIAQVFKQKSFWLVVSFFFGAGLLLALTPCVFPMIPILSGIIVGRGHQITKMHGFLLSLAYVLGMALTYAAVGVAAGLSGSLLSNALQTPAVLGSFAAVFVLLSLSMFGFYELQLPSALQSKLSGTSNRLHGGHLSGVFVMGALSAIIVSPCVAAPMAGALLYIGQTHDAVLGGVALFALAIGMGVPLLLVGASAGALLPKAGAWMEAIKNIFGVMMLAVAIWLISSLLPVSVVMLLWAALLIMSAVYLHALDPLPHNTGGWHKLGKGIGIIILLLGVSLLIGALSGARDILRPLGAMGGGQAVAQSSHVQFERIKNLAELDARVAQAKGKTVMLDFYADWCVSCKEMENFTFTDAKVQAQLKNTLLLQIDLTANNEDDKAFLKRYQLFGPPAILFFNREGKELPDYRVIGFQNAEVFLASIKRALG
ncbi:MAG: thiol:disulfide interchange protein [Gallionellales bacterium 35-53-114]|jgi:thiol:disulfide interchange protein DsbD|nr:MAG: thiol:disulfide interchange protein [Gallionellales bacterium 35-53-114]OYZ64474.1 MAG: thiol:disulfide interchange protein [Gallionellales bacterium 24-53-125]OZB10222.1 MAG: thiol:disulfide interchange protein [Gallionellales bacterium 39-52-133]HQS56811.1 protein-disulfide reductase DsbD [Gallionellaceae bacterium]HQS75405.1 protein-disulfide reductase DsbD [Gallionellaceae bacterium]